MSKAIPEFKNEDEERAFWATHDSSQYVDWNKARRVVFPNLRPTTRAISLRLPLSMLDELRQLANQRDVPYQSLIKVFLRDRIDQEYRLPAIAKGKAGYRPAKQKRTEQLENLRKHQKKMLAKYGDLPEGAIEMEKTRQEHDDEQGSLR